MKKILLLLCCVSALILSCKKSNADYSQIDRAIIHKYLADSSLVADSTADGLFYIISDPGSGAQPGDSSYVTVTYKGYLVDGTVFDQTSGTTSSFFLTSVVAGWREGMKLIKKGGKIKLLIPSALGYGGNSVGVIPANSVLIFDVNLLNVQ